MPPTDGLPVPQRYWALTTLLLGLVLVVVDDSVCTVALPTLTEAFDTAPSRAIWIVNSYQFVAAIFLIPMARLADIFGHRTIYCLGTLVFAFGALGCVLSDTLGQLIAARTLQGFGAAGAMSVNIALTRFIYPGRMLGRAIGYNGLVVATSISAGPIVAGAILDVASWPWLFIASFPLGIVVAGLGWKYLPVTGDRAERFDTPSAAMYALTVLLAIAGFGLASRYDAGTGAAILCVSALLGWTLWRREAAQQTPLVPIDLLDIRMFRLSLSASTIFFASQALVLISLPFYFQQTLGMSEVMMGVLITPWPLAIALIAPVSGRLVERYPPFLLGALGLSVMMFGIVMLILLPRDAQFWDIAWRAFVGGLGVGLFHVPNNQAIIASVPLHRSGAAAGMQSSARLFGQSFGVLAAGAVFAYATDRPAETALGIAVVLAGAAMIASTSRMRLETADE